MPIEVPALTFGSLRSILYSWKRTFNASTFYQWTSKDLNWTSYEAFRLSDIAPD